MWYIVPVSMKNEQEIARKCKDAVAEPGEDVFVMQRARFFQNQHIWERRVVKLFPGDVVIETDDIEAFRKRLMRVPSLGRLLKVEKTLQPVNPAEQELLERLGGTEHIIELSKGYRSNNKLVVTEGPMMGLEDLVKWSDRHKRMARLEIMLLGQPTEITLGVEIVEQAA